MNQALVIGYGNSLRRDDGLGPAVVRRLEMAEGVTVIEAVQLLPEHIEAAARARLVVLVDAGVDLEPGEVRCRLVEPPATSPPVVDLHELSPGALIGAARDLYGACPGVWSVTVGAADLGYGEGLSPEVEEAVDQARAAVMAVLDSR
jgi:hydrogenase maturation protease